MSGCERDGKARAATGPGADAIPGTATGPEQGAPRDAGRRDFFRMSALLAPGAGLVPLGGCGWLPGRHSDALADYAPQFFDTAEWRFVQAACDILIPEDDEGPGALSTHVPVFIDRQMMGEFGRAGRWYMAGPFDPSAQPDRGYQLPLTPRDVYRRGIAATDRHCTAAHGGAFATLTPDVRHAVLGDLESGTIAFPDVPAKTFFAFLWQNTKEGYFADPIHGGNRDMLAWRMIGYPGARAAYYEWVEKYDTPYPLGPVSLTGEGE